MENKIKLFCEPELDEEGNLIRDSLSEEEKARKLEINLNNDVLITNCGAPIIFVINKSDNPCQKYELKSDFILRHIRKIAINYGATVIFTSTKSNYNINVLYDYILHILFNFDLIHKSNLIDKNSYFIPSGYDRFSVLRSNDMNKDLDFEYSDVIKEEKEDEAKEEAEIKCEKISDYLKKVKDRKYKSRKSMMTDEIRNKGLGKKTEIRPKVQMEKDINQKIVDTTNEKTNKFKLFMDKKGSKLGTGEGETSEKDEKMTKEEKPKPSRQNMLNKLKRTKK